MAIKNARLAATPAEIHRATAKDECALSITFCNVTAAKVTFTMYAYPTGGSCVNGTKMLQRDLEPYGSYVWQGTEKFIMDVGDGIGAGASAADSVTATIVYVK